MGASAQQQLQQPFPQQQLPMAPPPGYPQAVQQPGVMPTMTPQQQQQLQQMVQSMPPEKLQMLQQQMMYSPQQQQQQQSMHMQPFQPQMPAPMGVAMPPAQWTDPALAANQPKPQNQKDEKQTGKVQRFLGDTLVGRFARASVQTASATFKMPAALSPWGDNNPVTLPNVRYRDAVLFTTFAFVGAPLIDGVDSAVTGVFGADSFVSEIVSSGAGAIVGSTVLKYGVFQIVEQAIDKGILEHMLPEEEKMCQTNNITVSICHVTKCLAWC
jgi:hypothetical protein